MRQISRRSARQPPESDAAMPLKALIFDVDGTLAETEEAHRQSFNQAFASFGLDWNWDKELYRRLLQVTGGKERLQHYINEWKPPGSAVAHSRFTEIYEKASARYAALVESGAVLARRGVRRLITEAHERGVRLAIATTSLQDSVLTLLQSGAGPGSKSVLDSVPAPASKTAPAAPAPSTPPPQGK